MEQGVARNDDGTLNVGNDFIGDDFFVNIVDSLFDETIATDLDWIDDINTNIACNNSNNTKSHDQTRLLYSGAIDESDCFKFITQVEAPTPAPTSTHTSSSTSPFDKVLFPAPAPLPLWLSPLPMYSTPNASHTIAQNSNQTHSLDETNLFNSPSQRLNTGGSKHMLYPSDQSCSGNPVMSNQDNLAFPTKCVQETIHESADASNYDVVNDHDDNCDGDGYVEAKDSYDDNEDDTYSPGYQLETKRKKRKSKRSYKNRQPYTGVTYHPISNKYRARIKIDGRTTHLGYFNTDIEAAMAYDRAAYELRGGEAKLNFGNLHTSIQNTLPIVHPFLSQKQRCILAARSVVDA